MKLRGLTLRNFRNISEEVIEFPGRLTLIFGDNGQGKTSIIEAVYLLAHAKSFRSNKIRELVRWRTAQDNVEDCSVEGVLASDSGVRKLKCVISKGKRSIFLNGNRLETASSFYGQLNCVVFTPDDLVLVKGAPTSRRSFLDRILAMSDRGYVDSLVSYQRALRSRNKVIAEGAPRDSVSTEQSQAVTPWDTLLVEHGRVVAEKRNELIQLLSPLAQNYYSLLVSNSGEKISVRYQSHFLGDSAELLSTTEMQKIYADSLSKDLNSRGTSVGTHRDEFLIEIDTGSDFRIARIGASQGQSRSIALSLKLAAVKVLLERTGELPILLLDDVESELDASRRAAFYGLLSDFDTQIIMTATEMSDELRAACPGLEFMRISAGSLLENNSKISD